MTDLQLDFLNVLRYSLFPDQIESECKGQMQNLSPELIMEARMQAVLPLVASSPEAYAIVSRNVQILYEQKQLEDVLYKASVPFAVLKGSAASVYYPEPLKRTLGDIDIIVRPEKFLEAYNTLKSLGYYTQDAPDKNERELHFAKNGILIELHRSYAELNTKAQESLLDQWIYDEILETTIGKVNDKTFPMLNEPLNGLILLSHIRHHLEAGLGFRQIIDWEMYVNRELHDDCWPLFKERTDQLGLTKLAKITARLGQIYLGLPEENITWCMDTDETLCEKLVDHVFECGNFGAKMGADNSVVTVFSKSNGVKGFFASLQNSGEKTWKALEKHPELTPAAWIYQGFRWAYRGIKNVTFSNLIRDYKDSKKRSGLMEELEVKKQRDDKRADEKSGATS